MTSVRWMGSTLAAGWAILSLAGCALSPARTEEQYCYRHEDQTGSENVRATVTGNQVTGAVQGTIHDQAAGYFTSYLRRFSGTFSGVSADLSLTTWIEYDVQRSRETWRFGEAELITADRVLPAADCARVSQAFQDADGFEASDLVAGAAATHRYRVPVAPGPSSATFQGGVVRGERDVYLVDAGGGRLLSLEVTAEGDNAVFDVITPSGLILVREATAEELVLPETGDYQVIVGGTWGNATYELTVTLR